MQKKHTLFFIILAFACSLAVFPAHAQVFVEPTSPTGGTTASPLNASLTTQRKLGSLIIGTAANPASLCLNTDTDTDTSNCIKSWSQVNAGSAYVLLNQTTFAVNPPATVDQHTTTQGDGYARLKADSTKNQLYTLIAEANSASSNATAVYATDNNVTTNYAGYFSGSVYVGKGSTATNRQLCLNDTVTLSGTSGGKGCISAWTDLGVLNPLGSFVALQPTPGVATAQTGGASLSGSAAVAGDLTAGVVIGTPVSSTPITYTCGDGICSTTTTPPENQTSCPADCGAIYYTVTMNFSGDYGTSKVTSAPAGMNCKPGCTFDYQGGASVQVILTKDTTKTFTNWSGGGCSGSSLTCTFTLTGNVTITANFTGTSDNPDDNPPVIGG